MEQSPERIEDGRRRVVIRGVSPELDSGRHPIKRTIGEMVTVEADIFADGHDVLSAVVRYRPSSSPLWSESPMALLQNDRWQGAFTVTGLGTYLYTVEGWVDDFKSWLHDLKKKQAAKVDVTVELLAGAALLERAAARAGERIDGQQLLSWARQLSDAKVETETRTEIALETRLAMLMERYPDRERATLYEKELGVVVDRELARYGAWYEMFPRSCSPVPGQHGTLRDCAAQLGRVAGMGFDILYLPPIHPIGRSFRKGKNNNPVAEPDDHGSAWAIGAAEGGHKSVDPKLGTLDDFDFLVGQARAKKLEVALDIAFQCAPDHPYVREGRDWFRKRPDGTIQYAENPPKKYQDIYPFDFECTDWRGLWAELKSIFEFWIGHGVKIFRVDNPHTKAFPFWAWCLPELKRKHPDLIFLSEAFTRPKVMYQLAKLGFTQSYNYFPWRNTRHELTEYFTELTQTEVREFFRANLWPNTPDILTQYLQYGGRPAFMARLILAATLGASYGIYGPAFELCENRPREIGSEEYLNSEKYEVKHWNTDAPGNLTPLITAINVVRRQNPALHQDATLRFHRTDNEQLIAYSKQTVAGDNIILTVVNLDPHHVRAGFVEVDLAQFKMESDEKYQVHDLMTGARYLWTGSRNYIELNPAFLPAHIFRVRRRARSEQDFDNFV